MIFHMMFDDVYSLEALSILMTARVMISSAALGQFDVLDLYGTYWLAMPREQAILQKKNRQSSVSPAECCLPISN